MPRYPCIKCDGLVDTHSDVVCPECGQKKPFECSKCEKTMNQVDIYQLEKLKTKKPLLCMDCGTANEVVNCGICKRGLVRSTGKQLSSAPTAKVYHKDCYEKQMHVVGMLKRVFMPIFGIVGFLVGYFMLGGMLGWMSGLVGAAAFVGLCLAGQVVLTPK